MAATIREKHVRCRSSISDCCIGHALRQGAQLRAVIFEGPIHPATRRSCGSRGSLRTAFDGEARARNAQQCWKKTLERAMCVEWSWSLEKVFGDRLTCVLLFALAISAFLRTVDRDFVALASLPAL